MKQRVGVCILGSGPAGNEIVSILSTKKKVEIIDLGGEDAGRLTEKVKYVILALPTEVSMQLVPQFLNCGITVIDLSGAFRLKDAAIFERYYGMEHACPEQLEKAVYGLPEMNWHQIRKATLIANPGCYATAVELALLPLVADGLLADPSVRIHIDAVSGYSGGGKHALRPKRTTGSTYKKSGRLDRGHQHVPEIEETLGLNGQIHFFPKIGSWYRGIEAKISLERLRYNLNIHDLYANFYEEQAGPLSYVRIMDKRPKLHDVTCTNLCQIFPRKRRNGQIEIIAAIDNLGKGAAGQAMQNLMLMNPKIFGGRVYENE